MACGTDCSYTAHHWAAAVRDDSGQIRVASGPKPLGAKAAEAVPGVRGVMKLAEAMAVIPLVKRALPEARLPCRTSRRSAPWALPRSAAPLSGRRFAPKPGRVRFRVGRQSASAGAGREAAVALLSLAPDCLRCATANCRLHGVEHKSIAATRTTADAAEATKEHDRCGSHWWPDAHRRRVGNVAARRAGMRGPAAEVVVGLGSAAVAVEVFAWGERHPQSSLTRLCVAPATRSSA